VALMAVIFYLSSQTAGPELAWWEVAIRKLGHLGGYAALTALWAWALSGAVRRPLAWAAAIALAYACTDEYHQTFVAGRHGTPVDVLIDSVGILGAVVLIRRHDRRRRAPGAPDANKLPDAAWRG
jgi:VanZ family protein